MDLENCRAAGNATCDGTPLAIEAHGIVKRFDGFTAVDGIDITVPEGAIYGILGPNGAGKTTTLRILLGIIDPDEGVRRVLGAERPHDVAHAIGYLPEERGLYPAMKAYEAIAFVGALRGLPLAEGRKRGRELLEEHGLAFAADRQIRQMSKGMAQQVQILGTLVHEPRLVVFDEPFSGLDALNQGRLERMIRSLAERGTTVIFSTHVIAHAERLCDEVAIIAGGRVPFVGPVDVARDRIRPQVRLETLAQDGPWRAAFPEDVSHEGNFWYFSLPESGVEPLLRALIEGEAGILSLSNLVEEKANKIIEILAAAIPMDAVFFGKLFAMLARAAQDATLWTHLVAIGWQALCVVVLVRTGARLFRTRVMKSGPAHTKETRRGLFARLRPARA